MERPFIPLGEASLAIDGLEVLDDELILVRGGLGARSGSQSGCGCGCGCGGDTPTVAPD